MNNVAVSLRQLTKVYRLYRKPVHRFFDMFGLLRKGQYTEHVAVSDLTLDIRRGEKVAIIGRNGAGKSTILKLISDVIEATSGHIEINGEVHALLSVGTGFHPEFTGRQNVESYLAQLGITGPTAIEYIKEIIEFAELDAYIDQPLKTYSSGMGVRLMFAASTAVTPDILVIDEVLAVGDAYFMQKCLQRMKEMCDRHGTTLILVTHDLYSAQIFCDRFIWLDQGKIALDGDGKSVVDAYEASVRDQEENRLRNLRLQALGENSEAHNLPEVVLCGSIRVADHGDIPAGLTVSHLSFLHGEQPIGEMAAASEGESAPVFAVLDEREGNWGASENSDGRIARPFVPHGSIFKTLPFLITDNAILETMAKGDLAIELGVRSEEPVCLEVELFSPDRSMSQTAQFTVPAGNWHDLRSPMGERAITDTEVQSPQVTPGISRYGRHAMEITDVQFLDGSGQEAMQFESGSKMHIRLSYKINEPDLDEYPTIVIAFMKDGVVRSHRFWTEEFRFCAADRTEGTLDMVTEELLLGSGTYLLNVSVYQEGFLTAPGPKPFFTANPKVYDMHSRAYEIVVLAGNKYALMDDVIFHHKCRWIMDESDIVET